MVAFPRQPPEDDPIFRLADEFPLGRPFGRVEVSQEPPSGPATRPFGLRYLVQPEPVAVIRPERITYDHQRQIAMVDGEPLHAQKHSSGKTHLPTAPSPGGTGDGDIGNPPDTAEDTEPD